MPHKRTPVGKKNQVEKKTLKKQAYDFVRANSWKDFVRDESVNQLTPDRVKDYLVQVNGGVLLRIINPPLYGSVLEGKVVLVQAAQGLVLEGTIKY
jgi:hypothetical protein